MNDLKKPATGLCILALATLHLGANAELPCAPPPMGTLHIVDLIQGLLKAARSRMKSASTRQHDGNTTQPYRRFGSINYRKLSAWMACLLAVGAAAAEPTVHWTCENPDNIPGALRGFHDFVPGVKGQCLQFGGFTTGVLGDPTLLDCLKNGKGFTLRAWVALGAYPWNWSPILEQGAFGKKGFSFGIDSNGRFGLGMQVGGQWVLCRSEIRDELQSVSGPKVDLELRQWQDLVAVFEPGKAIAIYRDGQLVKSVPLEPRSNPVMAPTNAVVIGMPKDPLPASHPVRTWATFAAPYSLDAKTTNPNLFPGNVREGYDRDVPKNRTHRNVGD